MKNLFLPKQKFRIAALLAILFVLVLAVHSCRKIEVPSVSKECLTNVDISVKKGKLQFHNFDDWQEVMQSITGENVERFAQFIKQKGLISQYQNKIEPVIPETKALRTSESVGVMSEIDSMRYADIVDVKLSLLLNNNHQLQIGDTVYHFQNDFTFTYLPQDSVYIEDFYRDLKNKTILIKDPKPVQYKGLTVYKTTVSMLTPNSTAGRVQGAVVARFDNTHRVWGNVYTHYCWFYSSAGTETVMQRYAEKCSGWWLWESCSMSWNHPFNVPYGDVKMNFDIWVLFDGILSEHLAGSIVGDERASNFLGEFYGANVRKFELHGATCHAGKYGGVWRSAGQRFVNAIRWNFPVAQLSCP